MHGLAAGGGDGDAGGGDLRLQRVEPGGIGLARLKEAVAAGHRCLVGGDAAAVGATAIARADVGPMASCLLDPNTA